MSGGASRNQGACLAALSMGLGMLGIADPASAEGRFPTFMQADYVRAPFSELYAAQEISTSLANTDSFNLRIGIPLGDEDRLWLRMAHAGYQLEDPDFPGTLHDRSETELVLGDNWAYSVLGGEFDMGLGYGLQHVSVSSSAKQPGTDPAFLFSPWHLYHGPTALVAYRHGLPLGCGFSLELEASPYVMTSLADAMLSMQPLSSVWGVARLSFWNDRIALGYSYRRMTGGGFNRESSGPLASLSLMGF